MTSMPWTPDHAIYHGWDGSTPTFFSVDRNAAVGADAKTHAVYCVVEIPIERPDGNGFPTNRERPAINAIEDAVVAQLERDFDAWYVGRVTGSGTIQVFLYLAHERLSGRGLFPSGPVDKDPKLLGAVKTAGGATLGHTIGVDPKWRMYTDFLAPTPFQELLINAVRVGTALDGHGDQADLPRTIDHFAHFPDAASAHAAAASLTGAGFTITNVGSEPGGDGTASVEFARLDARGTMEIERVLADVVSCIEPHGGEYDGWGCPVTTGAGTSDSGPSGTGRRGLLGRLRRAA